MGEYCEHVSHQRSFPYDISTLNANSRLSAGTALGVAKKNCMSFKSKQDAVFAIMMMDHNLVYLQYLMSHDVLGGIIKLKCSDRVMSFIYNIMRFRK